MAVVAMARMPVMRATPGMAVTGEMVVSGSSGQFRRLF
jgi:hypothetical protein